MVSRRHVTLSTFVLGALGVLLAHRAASGLEIAERLIPDDTTELLEPAAVLEPVEVARWPLRSLADLEGWTVADAAVTQGPAGLVWRATGRHPWLERTVHLDAATVDAFRVEATGKRRWAATVFWQRAEEPVASKRRAPSAEGRGRAPDSPREMTVAGIPEWSERIVRLRFNLLSSPGEDLSLAAVVAVRYRPDPKRWAVAASRPWKALLMGSDVGEARNALLAPRGHPIIRSVSVRQDARLLFDYGVQGRLPGRLCFVVRAAPATGEPLDLFNQCLEPGDTGRWISASADLAALGGREARLSFELAGDPGSALPLWANPEIVMPAAQQRPNVVLISIDTLRPDRLGIYGYRRETSPHLDRWARERAVTFDQAIAAAPKTIPSHVSMLSGVSALRHGVNYVGGAPTALLLLAEVLRASGYATLAVTGGGYMAPWVGLDQGFDRYAYWRRRKGARAEAELTSDVDLARHWLREVAARPFFLFFHTYEVHAPYVPRAPFFSRFNEAGLDLPPGGIGPGGKLHAADTGFVITQTPIRGRRSKKRPFGDGPLPRAALPLLDALYDAGVAYMDQEVGRLLQTLRELGIDRRTVVIFTSDHGEALGENGLAGHAYLFDFNLRVPLLLALADGRHAGKRVNAQVQSVDLVPTVLDLLGLPIPATVEGRSLLPLLSGERLGTSRAWSYAAQTNHGIALRLDGGLKYIFNNNAWPPAQGQERLLRVDRETGEEREEAGEVAQKDELRRELLGRYAADGPPALELTVVNHLATELSGRIGATTLRAMHVKAIDPPPTPLRWRRRSVEFAVPPGRRLHLFLEGGFATSLSLTLDAQTAAGSITVRERVPLDAIALPRALQVGTEQGARWSAGALPAGTSGVELAWRGGGRGMRQKAVTLPSEAEEHLRALGYDP